MEQMITKDFPNAWLRSFTVESTRLYWEDLSTPAVLNQAVTVTVEKTLPACH